MDLDLIYDEDDADLYRYMLRNYYVKIWKMWIVGPFRQGVSIHIHINIICIY